MNPSPELYPIERIELALEENGTTGYLWTLPEPNADFKVTPKAFDFDPNSPPGSGGVYHFTIDVYTPGSTIIFELRRPWEKDEEPVRRITIKVD